MSTFLTQQGIISGSGGGAGDGSDLAMMTFDGSTGYYRTTSAFGLGAYGSLIVARFNIAETGPNTNYIFRNQSSSGLYT